MGVARLACASTSLHHHSDAGSIQRPAGEKAAAHAQRSSRTGQAPLGEALQPPGRRHSWPGAVRGLQQKQVGVPPRSRRRSRTDASARQAGPPRKPPGGGRRHLRRGLQTDKAVGQPPLLGQWPASRRCLAWPIRSSNRSANAQPSAQTQAACCSPGHSGSAGLGI